MKKIKLTKGLFALVDNGDYPGLSKFRWFASSTSSGFYARRMSQRIFGIQKTIPMHRQIMDAPKGMVIDHINHDTLDNQRKNLRICTHAQNLSNRNGLDLKNTSGIRGVHFYKRSLKWRAYIGVRGEFIYLGTFPDKDSASNARRLAEKKYYGEFMTKGVLI